MTHHNPHELRELARAALQAIVEANAGDGARAGMRRDDAVQELRAALTPALVVALVDRLERADGALASANRQPDGLMTTPLL
jgi:hypothetical protein